MEGLLTHFNRGSSPVPLVHTLPSTPFLETTNMSRISASILAVLAATQGKSPCPQTRGATTNHIVPAIQAYNPIHTYVPTLGARGVQPFYFNISLTLADLVCLSATTLTHSF